MSTVLAILIPLLHALGAWVGSAQGLEVIGSLLTYALVHWKVSASATNIITAAAPGILKDIAAASQGKSLDEVKSIAAVQLKKEVPIVARIVAPTVSAQAKALVEAHFSTPPKLALAAPSDQQMKDVLGS